MKHTGSDIFTKNLNNLLKKHHMKGTDLARLLGITPAGSSLYILGKRPPPIDKIEKIEKIFNLPSGKLMGEGFRSLIDIEESSINHGFDPTPVYTYDELKSWVLTSKKPISTREVSMLGFLGKFEEKEGEPHFIPVIGNAMLSKDHQELSLKDGDFVLVHRIEPKIGDLVVIALNDEIKIRQLEKDGDSIIYKAFDKQIPIINDSKKVTVWGKIVKRLSSMS